MTDVRDRPAPEPPAEIWSLRLYVTAGTPNSRRALENLRSTCEKYLAGRYRIEVIDLLDNPGLGAADQILAVPTLVRTVPRPIRKIVGDLSDVERLLSGLQLDPAPTAKT